MKNIFFDFGRTLVGHPEDEAGRNVIRKRGVSDEKEIDLIQNTVFSVADYGNRLDEGSLDREIYRIEVLSKLPEHLRKAASDVIDYNISELPVIPGMEELLIKLKKDGFRLYITSNMDIYHSKQISDTRIYKYFDDMIFSAVVNTRKPYKEFFNRAFEKFNVNPKDCLFIDDLEENIIAGEKSGIRGFVFKGNSKEAEKFIYENN